MAEESRNYYSVGEVKAILARLSAVDVLRLGKLASFQARKLRDCDAEELLHEGLTRVLEGVRKWPRGLEVGPFMRNVLGSIATSMAKTAAVASGVLVDTEVDGSGVVDCPQFPMDNGSQSDATDVLYAEEMLNRATVLLADDPQTLAVALAAAEGLTAKEAQKRFNLSAKEFDAARNRLRRKLSALVNDEEVSA